MIWVRQNYDRFLLTLMALALAICAVLLFNNARNFSAVFASLANQVRRNEELPSDVTNLANAGLVAHEQESLAKPDQWNQRMLTKQQRLPLFVSVPYIAKTEVGPEGSSQPVLINPFVDDPKGVLHPPIPNSWLLDHNQDILASNVLEQDSDGDGFNTMEEYAAKTNPDDKNSHPPYWTKLYLKKYVRIPFVLRFDARNGDRFQVNTVDVDDAPTQFVKVGDIVTFKDAKFKVAKFEEKSAVIDKVKKDVSELTLVNMKNGQTVVLPKETDVDSPTTYAVFTYLWNGSQDFAVLKGGYLPPLKPDLNVKYKVLDMSDTEIKVLKEDENKVLSIRMRPQEQTSALGTRG